MDHEVVTSQPAAVGVLESVLNSLCQAFFLPIVVCVLAMFAFALVSLGGFLVEAMQRRLRSEALCLLEFPSDSTVESIELEILRQLESLRLCSRVAPMLGLVATMIPLGPALMALSSGNTSAQTETLGHSFSIVIIALLTASITFCVYTIRRRWLLSELHQWLARTSEDDVGAS
ncbi:MAG: MotA/TolQ/ExbB proton channel family protein [Planctomycetota bacterium]